MMQLRVKINGPLVVVPTLRQPLTGITESSYREHKDVATCQIRSSVGQIPQMEL